MLTKFTHYSILRRSMGYLETHGRAIGFPEAAQYSKYISEHAVAQFINLYRNHKDKSKDYKTSLKWGDETEFHVVRFDEKTKQVRLDFKAYEYRELFNNFYKNRPDKSVILQPEYGAWMFETIPPDPFPALSGSVFSGLCENYSQRRNLIRKFLKQFGDVSLISLPSYPMLGVYQYAVFGNENYQFSIRENTYSRSMFTFDKGINPHPRFPTLTRSIRKRRGEKVQIEVPLYMDENVKKIQNNTIYMDSMAFGMGCCCFQLTYDSYNINHARFLHDQLHAISPILSALSASSPIFRGLLSDQDLRFNVIEQAVDDRRVFEKDPKSPFYIPKSRYSMLNHYISNHPCVNTKKHNDTPRFNIDPRLMENLLNAGIDENLAYHIAAICSRDSLVIFSKAIYLDDTKRMAHFENLQTTNWNSVRFKPPPGMFSNMGWRVEFRPLDVQLTDFENSALAIFVGLLVKLINMEKVNFIIPISKCDENMRKAHKRNAILSEKFYFRSNIENLSAPEKIQEFTIFEILTGKKSVNYPGIIELINTNIIENPNENMLLHEKQTIRENLEFLIGRASGKYRTGAKLIRDFVTNHSEYKKNAVVTERMNYDLLRFLDKEGCKNDIKNLYK